jgi:hypothetical protein
MLRLSFDSAEHRIDAWKDPIHRARRAIRVMGFVRHVGEGTPNSVEKLGGRRVLWQATRRFDFERDGSGAGRVQVLLDRVSNVTRPLDCAAIVAGVKLQPCLIEPRREVVAKRPTGPREPTGNESYGVQANGGEDLLGRSAAPGPSRRRPESTSAVRVQRPSRTRHRARSDAPREPKQPRPRPARTNE